MVSNPEPPDGGWGWVIVICGFINHIFTVGLMMSLSVFYVSWLDQFGETKGATSWILSIGVACMFGLCPIPASLGVRFGFRKVAVLGGLLTSSGLILSVFATSVIYLVVTIGLITGLGCCFSFLPAIATVAVYFDHRRSLAMGLNTAGTGIGAFVLAPVLNHLEEMYGWRGAILILAGFTLHMCVTGLLMRDLGSETGGAMAGDSLEGNEACVRLADDRLTAVDDGAATLVNKVTRDDESNDVRDRVPSQYLEIARASEKHDFEIGGSGQARGRVCNSYASHGDLRKDTLLDSNLDHSGSFPCLDGRTLGGKGRAHRFNTGSVRNMNFALLASLPSILNERQRLGVSLLRVSNIPSSEKATDGLRRDSETTSLSGKRNCVSKMLSSKTIKANLALLSYKTHIAYCVSNFITNLSFITPVVFMVDRAVYQGISKSAGAILVSANGIGNVAGRLFFGYMAYRFPNRHICMYITALTVCGVGTMLSELCGNIVFLHVVYAFFFGFLMGTYIVLAPIVTLDLNGVSVFATAYGQVLSFMGIATIFGPPLAGWLFDWTRSYLVSYVTIGFFFVVSGVMLTPLLCSNRKKGQTSAMTREQSG